MQEAQHVLQQLIKQVAGGACEAPQHFPMVHFGSATPAMIETPAVAYAPTETIEPDEPDEPGMPYRQQFIDSEPPFESSFMDIMSARLGFNEPAEVSANSFTPLPPWISSTHDSAVVIETDSEDEDVHVEASPPPTPRMGGVRPGIGTWLTAAAVPALFVCLSTCIMDTVASSALCVEAAPPSVMYGD
ncbi:hypothetical protein CYMTET_34198 [Cymbomonas tetramitiformis]|uniref:Uncharacterized protein n=1 Tax=Cymbomonas tetramitiformis TaxID=36881 RepID=A0AAE0FBE3_9CHLO|nr:hypothetical protein CYMTET_34198 [Cymbomonas tetramitiformis]